MSLIASCHCGKISVEHPRVPTTATECNCSYCSKVGAVWAYFPAGELTVRSTDAPSSYSASDGVNVHHFCGTCGIEVWADTLDWMQIPDQSFELALADAPRRQAVNLRTVNDLDWSAITIEKVDGRSGW